MKIVILGCGPMPCEPSQPVMAPGARTWQIVQTVADALASAAGPMPDITVYGLEQQARPGGMKPAQVEVALSPSGDPGAAGACTIRYVPLLYDDFIALPARGLAPGGPLPAPVDAVIGTASAQPCATAAALAAAVQVPLWVDVFGDPFAEIQSKAELCPAEKEANDTRCHHVWKLMIGALLQGDRFSALSGRQRHALIGQLGAAGRLNRHTSGLDFVHAIPFGLFPADAPPYQPPVPAEAFTVMWCGSFNTWMDVDSLVGGIAGAVVREPRLRVRVAGGKIPNYNEDAYDQFVAGIRSAGVEHAVEFAGWQPLSEIPALMASCDAGLSIDRYTYEAVLGSRTRIVQFLAAGRPVISTNVAEIAGECARAGLLVPFELGDPGSLSGALCGAAARADEMRALAPRAREFAMEHCGGRRLGAPLAEWIRNPAFAPDKVEGSENDPTNPLTTYWRTVTGG